MKQLILSSLAGFTLVLLLATLAHPPSRLHSVKRRPAEDLSQLCESTAWVEGLWIQCHVGNIVGGLNNARNRLQTCIRLAIDAGAGETVWRHLESPANVLWAQMQCQTHVKTAEPELLWMDMMHFGC